MRRRVWWVALLLLAGCTHLFFQPMAQHVRQPSDLGLRYQDVWLTSADSVKLHAWYLPAPQAAVGNVLFLHGNAENISTHLGAVSWLPAAGFNLLLLDYRGYGRSQGTPSVPGALRDIDAAMAHLVASAEGKPIIIFGQSLGGALAILYSAQSRYREAIRAVVADSAFSDFRGIAKEKLSGSAALRLLATPLSWTIHHRPSPLESIAKVAPIPVLLIHGEKDRVVPVTHSQRLYEAAQAPKFLWRAPEAGHIAALADPALRQRFVQFLRRPGESWPENN